MHQGTMGRLLNRSEGCQVRKIASLLAEALRQQFGVPHRSSCVTLVYTGFGGTKQSRRL